MPNDFSHLSRSASIAISVFAYIVAIGLAVVAGSMTPTYWHPLATIGVADIVGTIVIFLFSFSFNNSSFYDPYWSVKPAVIALYYMLAFPDSGTPVRRWLVLILAFLYGIRLTANFYRGWPGLVKQDWRYTMLQSQYPKTYWLISFSGIHFFPTLMVYLACLPMYPAMVKSASSLSFLDIAGSIVTFLAVLIAFIADEQMGKFRQNPGNSGRIMTSGLWRHSRHPNYLGEILTWWGLWFFAIACGLEWWWTGIGALSIMLMFIFISIPMMDEHLKERKSGFAEHMQKTRAIIPLPVK
jgi:steroid 5-alpha reductase family enzyme